MTVRHLLQFCKMHLPMWDGKLWSGRNCCKHHGDRRHWVQGYGQGDMRICTCVELELIIRALPMSNLHCTEFVIQNGT